MAKFFQCNKCGTVFPEDYIENFGRKYGIGLGPEPVCEAMDSNYQAKPVASEADPATFMHPVGVCKGRVQMVDMPKETETAILAIDDPFMMKRAAKMREIQKGKSETVRVHHAKIAA